jgi:hypothetical protein
MTRLNCRMDGDKAYLRFILSAMREKLAGVRKRERLSIEGRPPQDFNAGATMMWREPYEL